MTFDPLVLSGTCSKVKVIGHSSRSQDAWLWMSVSRSRIARYDVTHFRWFGDFFVVLEWLVSCRPHD